MARRKITLSSSLPKPAPPPEKADPWAEAPDTDEQAVARAMDSPFRQALRERVQQDRQRVRHQDRRQVFTPAQLAEAYRNIELGDLFQRSLECPVCSGTGFEQMLNVTTASGHQLPPYAAPCRQDNCAIGSVTRVLWQVRRQVAGR